MRYNSFNNGSVHIIVDSETKTMIAEVYKEDVANLIVNALNGTVVEGHRVVTISSKTPDEEIKEHQEPDEVKATIGDKTESDNGEPEYWKTGIKKIGGVDHYKCFYKCFNCSNQGKHYIPKEVRHIFCHECGFELPVTTATSAGFPNRDDFGNYFVSKHVATGDTKLVTKTWSTANKNSNFLS